MARHFFSSESVTEGHPDKVCDQISDAILDALLEQDPNSRVACDCATNTGIVLIMGEITSKAHVDYIRIARSVLKDIGYVKSEYGIDGNSCAILTSIDEQSQDIALGVDKAMEAKAGHQHESLQIGAGDQGMVFGYACDDTKEFMPLPISLAHALTRQLAKVRKDGTLAYLRPDGKSQVTVEYEGNTPMRIDTVVLSAQHAPEISMEQLRVDLLLHVIQQVLPKEYLDENTRYLINPTGRFVVGGPQGDSGLTGRKIIVDTYGGWSRHGGGAFSGKDPTKVDRSGAYAARYVAKNIVAAGLAERLEIQIAYAIGVAEPVSIHIDTFGTGKIPDAEISKLISKHFDLRPAGIIRMLSLRKPIYRRVSNYGHLGRIDVDLPWERMDKVDALRADVR